MARSKGFSFRAQIQGSARISAEGDIYPKISIPFEEKEKLPNWMELAGAMVRITIEIPNER